MELESWTTTAWRLVDVVTPGVGCVLVLPKAMGVFLHPTSRHGVFLVGRMFCLMFFLGIQCDFESCGIKK